MMNSKVVVVVVVVEEGRRSVRGSEGGGEKEREEVRGRASREQRDVGAVRYGRFENKMQQQQQ